MSARPHQDPAAHTAAPPRKNGAPRPVAFPSRPATEELCRTRANTDNERWRAQVEQRDTLIQAAAREGYAQGERAGYTQGWHWGLACGICAGGSAVGALWIVWAPLQRLLASVGLA
jgi:flagellar biosynthesis/type III secretory pathway protein FliH